MPTSTVEWKKDKGPQPVTYEGRTMMMRRKPLEAFWKQGFIPNALNPYVEALFSGEEAPEIKGREQMLAMVELLDSVVVACSVDPQVHPEPENEGERNSNLLYIDEIDIDEKMFRYKWCVGLSDELIFRREESTIDVGSVAEKPNLDGKAEQPSTPEGSLPKMVS